MKKTILALFLALFLLIIFTAVSCAEENRIFGSSFSREELTRIMNSAPYVSSKDITITSAEGVDFYTYFGSGIIMSGTSGDCFKLEELDDEIIIDHYKILPLKVGKGKIEYVINMKKKIVVNVTVKKSAFEEPIDLDSLGAKATATVKKFVNIREEPSADSKKIGSADAGDMLIVIEPYYSAKWHQILYDNQICYVSANYVIIDE